MRLRNITGSREFIAANPYVIGEPEKLKGEWKRFFSNDNPINIEIGMGKGKFIHELAVRNPNINYIGIEKYSSVLYRAIEKRTSLVLDNLFFLRLDAEILPAVFAEDEIGRIYLNFSDPWPKDRHAKRRLTSPLFFNIYHQILNDTGSVIFKTDNRTLFDYSIRSVTETPPWKLRDITYDLHNSPYAGENILTEYETRFAGMGLPIHKFVAFR